jgi:hypothetical protein
MTFCEFIICCQLARAIHGSDDSIRYTARQCRDLVSREHRPLLSKIMRHEKAGKWLELYDEMQ